MNVISPWNALDAACLAVRKNADIFQDVKPHSKTMFTLFKSNVKIPSL